jgi:hypothetical protein
MKYLSLFFLFINPIWAATEPSICTGEYALCAASGTTCKIGNETNTFNIPYFA